jgi:hypothetical protein
MRACVVNVMGSVLCGCGARMAPVPANLSSREQHIIRMQEEAVYIAERPMAAIDRGETTYTHVGAIIPPEILLIVMGNILEDDGVDPSFATGHPLESLWILRRNALRVLPLRLVCRHWFDLSGDLFLWRRLAKATIHSAAPFYELRYRSYTDPARPMMRRAQRAWSLHNNGTDDIRPEADPLGVVFEILRVPIHEIICQFDGCWSADPGRGAGVLPCNLCHADCVVCVDCIVDDMAPLCRDCIKKWHRRVAQLK